MAYDEELAGRIPTPARNRTGRRDMFRCLAPSRVRKRLGHIRHVPVPGTETCPDEARPIPTVRKRAQTSTMTGNTIGRRRVRS
jgi:hypothetical protein